MDLFDDDVRTSLRLLSDYIANLAIIEMQIAGNGSDITAPLPLIKQRKKIQDQIHSLKQQLYDKGLSDDDIATGLRLHTAHSWPTSRVPSQPQSSVMQKTSGFGWTIAAITIITVVVGLSWAILQQKNDKAIGSQTPIVAINDHLNTPTVSSPPSININDSPDAVGIINNGSGDQYFNINPPNPTPVPTPTPQSHRFHIPAHGFETLEFQWEPNPQNYGAIIARICTPSPKYWVYSEEIEPDPKEITRNIPMRKEEDCAKALIANSVTPHDLIRTEIGIVGENDPPGTPITMRRFDIRRTAANDIEVIELSLTSRSLPRLSQEPFGCIDVPAENSILSGDSGIGGWALAEGSVITKVEIWIDDQFYGQATYGIERPDTNYKIVETGWHFNFDTRALPNGLYKIHVKATSADGITQKIACGIDPVYDIPIEIKN